MASTTHMNDQNDQNDAPDQADKRVINLDDDPDNANWLRILAQRRREHGEQRGDATDGQDDEANNG